MDYTKFKLEEILYPVNYDLYNILTKCESVFDDVFIKNSKLKINEKNSINDIKPITGKGYELKARSMQVNLAKNLKTHNISFYNQKNSYNNDKIIKNVNYDDLPPLEDDNGNLIN